MTFGWKRRKTEHDTVHWLELNGVQVCIELETQTATRNLKNIWFVQAVYP